MKKIIFIAIMMILIVACEEEQKTAKPRFMGGTQGLVFEFEDFGVIEEGVSSVYSTESFPVVVNVKNKGEYSVNPGELIVRIKGISLQDFQGILPEMRNDKKIEGISEFNIGGGETQLNFAPGKARYAVPVVGVYQPFEIYADAIYNYQTQVVMPQICFKENLKDTSVCEVKATKEVYTSGAPLTIDSVEEDTAGQGIIALKIVVRNAGSGKVTSPNIEFDDRYNKFAFTSPQGFQCISGGSDNEAKFIEGKAEIRCKLKEPLQKDAAYVKPLDMTLSYKYKEQINKPIRILSPR
ncbi:MAG: hypothetical protein QW331_01880 [Candidatus Woesearchaeota archaeon]